MNNYPYVSCELKEADRYAYPVDIQSSATIQHLCSHAVKDIAEAQKP